VAGDLHARLVLRLHLPRRGGKQRRKSFRKLGDAQAFKGRVTADLAEGSFRQESRVSFAEYADSWRETYRRSRGIRESSMKEYDRAIRVAAEHFGKRRLSSIRTLDIERYVLGFIDAGLSYSTARLQLAALRGAVRDGGQARAARAEPVHGRAPAPTRR
jgi:hypothetical protein